MPLAGFTLLAGAQMVLTLKMISAAVCYQDGLKDAKVTSLASSSALLGSNTMRSPACGNKPL